MLFIVILIASILSSEQLYAHEVDLSWLQEILDKKDRNEAKNRHQAYELIQGIKGKRPDQEPRESRVCGGAAVPDNSSVEGRYPTLLVFVSFSMPMESLKHLGEQVRKAGGTLVFRGLVNDSFPETAQKTRELGTEAMIDPTLFEAFKIESVPTFVLLEKPLQQMDLLPAYDQVAGHISLRHALESFAKGGNNRAIKSLSMMQGEQK